MTRILNIHAESGGALSLLGNLGARFVCTCCDYFVWALQVDVSCFDKTGTLTSDDMVIIVCTFFGAYNPLSAHPPVAIIQEL